MIEIMFTRVLAVECTGSSYWLNDNDRKVCSDENIKGHLGKLKQIYRKIFLTEKKKNKENEYANLQNENNEHNDRNINNSRNMIAVSQMRDVILLISVQSEYSGS